MSAPSLQKTTILSFVLHITAFLIIFLFLKQSNQAIYPQMYMVSLVSPDISTHSRGKEKNVTADSVRIPKKSVSKAETSKKIKKDNSQNKKMVEEKIAILEAKKNIEKIVKLRSTIPLKAKEDNPKEGSQKITGTEGSLFGDYYAKITQEIREQWIFPDTSLRELEAIVSVRILKDGTAIVQKMEKSSGNILFDRSILKALAKASPLSPPPYEMEIGIRFYP